MLKRRAKGVPDADGNPGRRGARVLRRAQGRLPRSRTPARLGHRPSQAEACRDRGALPRRRRGDRRARGASSCARKSIDPLAKAERAASISRATSAFVSPPGDPRGAQPARPRGGARAGFRDPGRRTTCSRASCKAGGRSSTSCGSRSKIDAHERTFAEAERTIRVKLAQDKLRAKQEALLDELRSEFPVQIDEAALAQVKVDLRGQTPAQPTKATLPIGRDASVRTPCGQAAAAMVRSSRAKRSPAMTSAYRSLTRSAGPDAATGATGMAAPPCRRARRRLSRAPSRSRRASWRGAARRAARAAPRASRRTTSRSATRTTRRARCAGSASPTRARRRRCPAISPTRSARSRTRSRRTSCSATRIARSSSRPIAAPSTAASARARAWSATAAARCRSRRSRPALRVPARAPEVRDVIVSGGDPLAMATDRLVRLVARGARHPQRRDDPPRDARAGHAADADHGRARARAAAATIPIWVMTHFNHPKELTPRGSRAL